MAMLFTTWRAKVVCVMCVCDVCVICVDMCGYEIYLWLSEMIGGVL